MKLWLRATCLSVTYLVWTSALATELPDIRSGLNALHQVQDEIARGTTDSSQFQTVILDRVTTSLELLPEAALSNPELQQALAELALSGGERARVEKLIRKAEDKGPLTSLLSGVDAYLNDDMGKAAEAFEVAKLDIHGTHAAHFVELARGTALLEADLPKATEAFQLAMLYAPGTLVEEVALRRLIGISLKLQDPDLLMRCANLYLRRYKSSPFAREFLSNFSAGALLVTNREDLARLGKLVMLLPTSTSRPLLYALTVELLSQGKLDIAKVFADHSRTAIDDNTVVAEQNAELQLFEILIGMDDAATADDLPTLQNFEGKLAEPGMQELLEVARHVAWNIHKPLTPSSGAEPDQTAKDADMADDFIVADQIMAQATTVLDRFKTTKDTTQ